MVFEMGCAPFAFAGGVPARRIWQMSGFQEGAMHL
jgi:hypothetical protein